VKSRALGFAALLLGAHATAQEPARHQWDLLVGHSYSSARALTQPATLVLEKTRGSPLYSVLDVGALLRGSLADRTWLELGARAHAGSARPESQRVFGAVARRTGSWIRCSSQSAASTRPTVASDSNGRPRPRS